MEAGSIVGDGDDSVHPWRYSEDVDVTSTSGTKPVHRQHSAGQAMPPSMEMTPLDDEAKKMYNQQFPDRAYPIDPDKPKPAAIQGKGNVGIARPTPPPPKTIVPPKPTPPTATKG